MTDATEFDLDLSLSQTLSHGQQVELYAFDECKAYAMPDRKLLLRNPDSGRTTVIMPEVLAALRLCTAFAPLTDHMAAIEKGMPRLRGQGDEIRQVLESMIRDGMMVNAAALCEAFNNVAVDKGEEPEPTAIVAIITCDRPEALERLLNSIRENGDPAGFEKLYVIDDSRDADCIERNREIVSAFDSASDIDAGYFGRAQQAALMNGMVAKAPEHEASIRFLVDFERWRDEATYGLARNYALLLSVGKRLVMLDDDTLFEVHEPQPRPAGVTLRNEIREAEFFGSGGEWPGLKHRPELDPVKAHLFCLGLPLKTALGRLGVSALLPEHLAGCTAREVRRLGAHSPVLVTEAGSLGDSGVGNNRWLIELEGESRRKMLASPESVARAIANDNAWIGRKQPHIEQQANMSQTIGLDNRRVLPPYFPIHRGEDRLFGLMLKTLVPDVTVLDYPWAVPHMPLESRDRSDSSPGFVPRSGLSVSFRRWLNEQAGLRKTDDEALGWRSLAGWFAELAAMGDGALNELADDTFFQTGSQDMRDLVQRLSEVNDAPPQWRAFLQAGLTEVNAELTRAMSAEPSAANRISPVDAEQWRERWGTFGVVVEAWKDIRRAAVSPAQAS